MEKLNVAIADDNEKMVEVLSKIIDQDEELKLVGKEIGRASCRERV